MGLSENSVPLHPMVNDQISLLNGYNWEYTPFSDIPKCWRVFGFFMRYLVTTKVGEEGESLWVLGMNIDQLR